MQWLCFNLANFSFEKILKNLWKIFNPSALWCFLGRAPSNHNPEPIWQHWPNLTIFKLKKLRKKVGALLRGGLPADPERRQKVFELASQCLDRKGRSTYEAYTDLIVDLTKAGFVLDPNFSIFIKSQVTLMGIFQGLDPTLDIDKYLEQRAKKQVAREMPKRALLFPALHYRGYRSMMSNWEVLKELF